jgi:hypothetical protein
MLTEAKALWSRLRRHELRHGLIVKKFSTSEMWLNKERGYWADGCQ